MYKRLLTAIAVHHSLCSNVPMSSGPKSIAKPQAVLKHRSTAALITKLKKYTCNTATITILIRVLYIY